MKIFILIIVFLVTSIHVIAQNFYVSNTSSIIKSEIERWLTSNGYSVASTATNPGYTISYPLVDISKKESKVFFTVTDNADSRIAVSVSSEKLVKRKIESIDYIEVLNEKLSTDLKKIKEKELQSKAFNIFYEDTLKVVRGRLDQIRNVTFKFGGTKTDEYNVEITKVSNGQDVTFNSSPGNVTVVFDGKGAQTYDLAILIKADTTIKDSREEVFSVKYKRVGELSYIGGQYLRVITSVTAIKKSAPVPFKKVDFMLFVGTTLDPNNTANKVKGVSIEGVIPFEITPRIFMRVGAYLHPNFSRDTGALNVREFYRLNKDPLIEGQTGIGRSRGVVSHSKSIESIGVYADILTPFNSKRIADGVRISPALHLEWVQRNVNPIMKFSSVLTDTIKYTSAQFPDTTRIPFERFDVKDISSSEVVTQGFINVSLIFEVNYTDVYLYIQPYMGLVLETRKLANGRFYPIVHSSPRESFGFSLAVKLFNSFTISADVKDIFRRNNYTNISFGIPLTLSEVLKKKSS